MTKSRIRQEDGAEARLSLLLVFSDVLLLYVSQSEGGKSDEIRGRLTVESQIRRMATLGL